MKIEVRNKCSDYKSYRAAHPWFEFFCEGKKAELVDG